MSLFSLIVNPTFGLFGKGDGDRQLVSPSGVRDPNTELFSKKQGPEKKTVPKLPLRSTTPKSEPAVSRKPPPPPTGSLKVQFIYGADLVDAPQANDALYVNPKNGGISDILVRMSMSRRLKRAAEGQLVADEKKVEVWPSGLIPRGNVVRLGESRTFVTDIDLVLKPKFPSLLDDITVNRQSTVVFDKTTPIPIGLSYKRTSLGWVLVVAEEEIVGVSDKNGQLVLDGLRIGRACFDVWHEIANKILPDELAGVAAIWRDSFIVEVKEGVNDLGVIRVSPDTFFKK